MYLNRAVSGFVLLAVAGAASAAPTGGSVAEGSAEIKKNGNTTDITVHSDKAIINWQDFSIGESETVNFIDKQNTVTLNRVTGSQASKIHGRMTASGKIFLINPNGIVFGKNATIDVGGLLASTTDITNQNFLAGNYRFDQVVNPDASILIEPGAEVSIKSAGMAALVAPSVENLGIIKADLDKIVLAAGDVYTLDLYGDGLITFDASSTLKRAEVTNAGEIVAQNNNVDVILTAAAVDDLLESAVNASGIIEANRVVLSGDKVQLLGGTVTANTTDVYYTADDYAQPIDYAASIAGDTTSHIWVHNATGLQNIDQANSLVLSNNYILSGDIDLASMQFNPIGDSANAFTGTLDFNDHSIANMTVDQTSNHAGLFAVLNGASIIGADLQNANVTGNHYVGALAGVSSNSTFADGIHVSTTGITGLDNVGGVFGQLQESTIAGPVAVELGGDIRGRYQVGGISGLINGNNSIAENSSISVMGDNNIYASGLVTGNRWVKYRHASAGGVAGVISNNAGQTTSLGNVIVNVNNIEGAGNNVGGVAGKISSNGDLNLSNAAVKVNNISSTNDFVGGIAGEIYAANDTDYQNLSVTANNIEGARWVGGLFGLYSAGADKAFSFNETRVTANHIGSNAGKNVFNVGGLIGELNARGSSFDFDGDVNVAVTEIDGQDSAGGLFGRLGLTQGYIPGSGNSTINFNEAVNLDVGTIYGQDYRGYGGNRTGGIAGYTIYTDITFMQDPKLNVQEIQGGYSLGGLFGDIQNSSVAGNLSNNATIVSDGGSVGGLMGYANNITNTGSMVNYGDVTGEDYYVAGGFGYIEDSTVSHIGNHGNVTGVESVGGVAGTAYRSDLSFVYSINEEGYVQGDNKVGGIVGELGWQSSIVNAISASNIIANNQDVGYAGGIVAINDGIISNALALNSSVVGADEYTGAIAGKNWGTIENVLLDTERSSIDGGLMTMVAEDYGMNPTIYNVHDKEIYHRNSTVYTDQSFDFTTDWQISNSNTQSYYASQQWCGLSCAVQINIPISQVVASTSAATNQYQIDDDYLLGSDNSDALYSSLNYLQLVQALEQETTNHLTSKVDAKTVADTLAIETYAMDYKSNAATDSKGHNQHNMQERLADILIDIHSSN
jgi:filamentous hemagglutinin family protein